VIFPRTAVLAATLVLAAAASSLAAGTAAAAGNATWSGKEQLTPSGSKWPIGLGKIGDIEFWAPNRGLLITSGNPPTVPAGVWAYNGVEWHELATVCGATEGHIAWAGPGEFWTVSDGRAAQANESTGSLERTPLLEDNTLCHFSGGQLVASYAHPAFQPDSYQAMHAAACFGPSDCWFAGDPLEEPQIGAFQLHWNGSSLESEPYLAEGHAVEDMRALEGHLYESVRISSKDRVSESSTTVPVLHRVNPEGVLPAIEPEDGRFEEGLPLYAPKELADALDPLHLSSADGAMWAAAGKSSEPVEPGHVPGHVTLVRGVGGIWEQLIGPEHPLGPILPTDPSEEEELLGHEAKKKEEAGEKEEPSGEAKDAVVSAIAAEPGTDSAWLALTSPESSSAQARAVLVHVSAEGQVLEEQTLPSAREEEEGIGPKGAAAKLSCPEVNDCWLATTQGWLFHLAPAGERSLPKDPGESEYFTGLITYRPPDLGLPQVPPDAPPLDDSGLVEEAPGYGGTFAETKALATPSKVTLPLLSRMHSRLVNGSTLELSFHLAVKARVRLIAKRRSLVVAATAMRTLKAGNCKLLLALNPKRWPTKLSLQTHALAPLPSVSSVTGEGAGVTTVTTGLFVLPRTLLHGGLLP
jgi:hypothetical protein